MIAQHYPAPRPVAVVHTLPWDNSRYSRAQKVGLSILDYDNRVNIVEDALKDLDCNVGDKVYPYSSALFHKHGCAKIVAICRHYDQYGDATWDDAKPMIVSAYWEDKPNEIFNCTANYLTTQPKYIKELCS